VLPLKRAGELYGGTERLVQD